MSKKKIMILGATGMAGHMIYHQLSKREDLEIINLAYRKKLNSKTVIIDLLSNDNVAEIINFHKPEILINCVGILIKGANENPDRAIYLNSYLPHLLSKLLRANNGRLIHISTDCVFSGLKGPYKPDDPKDSQDFYGLTKALGEVINENDVTIRTSIIGPELKEDGEGLLHWFLKQTGILNGYTEVYWSGVTTLQLAKIIDKIIDKPLTGLFQYSHGQKISKFQLLNIFKEVWQKQNIEIIPISEKKVDKSLVPTDSKIFCPAPDYLQMCRELSLYMNKNKALYSQYL